MIIDLPDTSTSALTKRLISLREEGGAIALSRVLTLVIDVDEDRAEDAIASAITASHEHPCRIVALVHAGRRGASRVDGQIRVGGDAAASEVIVMRLHGEVDAQGHALVLPLLLADSPVVGWWPGEAPEDLAADPVGELCHRRISDSAVAKDPYAELQRRAKNYSDGDTDLAWARITTWRALLAAALDVRPYETITGAVVSGGVDSSATDLLAAWLAQALDVPVTRARTPAGSGLISVRLDRPSGPLDLVRPEGTTLATLSHPLQPVRRIELKRRSDADCLTDELRRLDADEVFEEALVKGLAKVHSRDATSSRLIKAGKAPSPEESRRLAAKIGRTRTTSSDMVTIDEEAATVHATDKAPDPHTARRAQQQKRLGTKITDDVPTVEVVHADGADGKGGDGRGRRSAGEGASARSSRKGTS
ncbi:glucose-6-phosphate dehydrogenase assembly protein OpcA [Arsenicicoccus dermatophilus]|uniref:glucose-6-phosphate dehydrogenase assembly protein OpcA n=1 Tax=Arsenicicoccus dermatophilus TaxID=1076331 RepID=UPI00391740ED